MYCVKYVFYMFNDKFANNSKYNKKIKYEYLYYVLTSESVVSLVGLGFNLLFKNVID